MFQGREGTLRMAYSMPTEWSYIHISIALVQLGPTDFCLAATTNRKCFL